MEGGALNQVAGTSVENEKFLAAIERGAVSASDFLSASSAFLENSDLYDQVCRKWMRHYQGWDIIGVLALFADVLKSNGNIFGALQIYRKMLAEFQLDPAILSQIRLLLNQVGFDQYAQNQYIASPMIDAEMVRGGDAILKRISRGGLSFSELLVLLNSVDRATKIILLMKWVGFHRLSPFCGVALAYSAINRYYSGDREGAFEWFESARGLKGAEAFCCAALHKIHGKKYKKNSDARYNWSKFIAGVSAHLDEKYEDAIAIYDELAGDNPTEKDIILSIGLLAIDCNFGGRIDALAHLKMGL